MQWYETIEGEKRLELEMDLLALDYPRVKPVICDDGCIAVHGKLGKGTLLKKDYTIFAKYPATYPQGRVRVWLPDEIFGWFTPHTWDSSEGEICLEHGDFQPSDTISTVLGWAIQWCVLYEEYKERGTTW